MGFGRALLLTVNNPVDEPSLDNGEDETAGPADDPGAYVYEGADDLDQPMRDLTTEAELTGPVQVPGDYIRVGSLEHTDHVNNLLKEKGQFFGFEVHEAMYAADKIHYSLKSAMAENPGFADADRVELDHMRSHDVWEEVPMTELSHAERRNMARCHMLRYKKFSGESGTRVLQKLKSRLVYDGKSQSSAQSGTDTKSSTPRNATVLMHFGVYSGKDQVCRKADLTSAFLKAPQHTADGSESYVRFPADIATFRTVNGRRVEVVYRLKRSLYGQKNSPKRFEILFSNWMVKDAGMIRSTVDPSIYYSKCGRLRVLQFVDDSCLIGDSELAKAFETLFEKRWGSKFEDCDYYLNMRIRKDADGFNSISQPHYVEELLNKYDMKNGRGVTTPLVNLVLM